MLVLKEKIIASQKSTFKPQMSISNPRTNPRMRDPVQVVVEVSKTRAEKPRAESKQTQQAEFARPEHQAASLIISHLRSPSPIKG